MQPLRHRLGFALLGVSLVACVATGFGCGPREAPRPNVVLLMADDLGFGDVGWNGHPARITPELDELAHNGMRFDRFYSAPVCSQTRGSVLTGRNSRRFGVDGANAGVLPKSEITLAEVLQGEGYATGLFGKWHLGAMTADESDAHRGGGPAAYSPPWEHGFDINFATEARVPTFDPLVDNADERIGASAYWSGPGSRVPDGPAVRGDDSRILMDQALGFIRDAADQQRPFLAVVWFHAPHVPVRADPSDTTWANIRNPELRAYYSVVTALDRQIGRLRAELRALGIANDTLLVFCSDNGPRDGPGRSGALRGGKDSLFEGGIRVPAVVEWPGRVVASVSRAAASTDDLFPTVLDLLGLPIPDDRHYDGVSLRDVLEGRSWQRTRPIGVETGDARAWIVGPLKLVRHSRREPFQLYDVEADPGEARNIARGRPTRVAEMSVGLEAWRRGVARDRAGLRGR